MPLFEIVEMCAYCPGTHGKHWPSCPNATYDDEDHKKRAFEYRAGAQAKKEGAEFNNDWTPSFMLGYGRFE